ncbi:MAG: FG-GAP-like repeat-containing protein [Planctomycetes bacterium]|nr:FG-GAP-like repeat-containing protein [Planctomycetota bacterium]MCH9723709.1 FG-GAP-like repeat-containing protein [Planctomycetota bacterium]MCH9776021.1 FG-GAP-like repeat-containing protein [Planctomycetota bacterium]MCH9790195.1 FG-GAP-like repeat-containing protein [Planctomycetota bacterium]
MSYRSSHIAIIVAVVLFLGMLILFSTVEQPPPANGPAEFQSISYEKANELLRYKNEGIAYLENERYQDSDPLLERLTEGLPSEVIGFRNLTICRLLQLTPEKVSDQKAGQELTKQAIATVDQLIQIAPTSEISYVLSSRIYTALSDHPRALTALQKAMELDPKNAVIWFEISQVQKQIQNPEVQKEAKTSLKTAWELQPDNLFLTLDYLQIVAEQKTKQAALVFGKVKQLAGPLADSVKDHTRLDLNKLIDDSLAAVKEEKWNTVIRNARILRNVLIAEDLVKSDRRRVEQNPLEFVIHDFPPAFYTAVKWPDPEQPLSVDFDEVNPLPFSKAPSTEIRDFQIDDFNLDGKPDLILLSSQQVSIFSRNANNAWELMTQQDCGGDYSQVYIVDLDADVQQFNQSATTEKREQKVFPISPSRDADLDLVLAGKSGLKIFENQWDSKTGKRSLVVKAQKNTLETLDNVLAINFSDLDHDGDLDLVASTSKGLSLWSNRGDFSFQDISANSQLPPADLGVTSIIRVDWDRDVDLDLILSSRQSKQSGYLENLRHGRFRWRQFDAEEPQAAINQFEECQLTDFDRNGSWDLIGVSDSTLMLAETNRPSPGSVQIVSVQPLKESEPVNAEGTGLQTGDLNNDGVLDFVASTPKGLQLCLGTAERKVEQAAYRKDQVLVFPKPIQKYRLHDLNQDGSLDLIALADNELIHWHNKGNDYHWIDVSLRAEQVKGEVKSASGRVNHYGVGSLLELRSGAIYQPQIVDGQTTHFGLGKQTVAEAIRVLWTNGIPMNIINAKSDQRIYEKQTLMGSCPYLYTWDGEKFVFHTDLLWAAPIGLQFGKGIVAPCRDWEFLKIEGDRLKAKDGFFELRITEELWEAGYFDLVELIAVDHPAEVDIFTNEKVGPPELAEFDIHVVRHPQIPRAAVNHRKRDVLPEIKDADDIYAKTFDEKYRQGLTENHALELDLNAQAVQTAKTTPRIKLFLTGWLYPTDTGINLALSENPSMPSPQPPSLSVPDKNGNWKVIQPFMGFPGGKTKTIVVDLKDQFLTNDYRVRIETNMEFYWDQVFFTVNETADEWTTQPSPLESATLNYRGFSTPLIHPGNGPERYDYHSLSNTIQWPPMQGHFTRYGDVKPLVESADNRLVILGAGDEMRLRFSSPEIPVKPGWKRDFILHNIGWDKDANLHTILGQSVEPLPFQEMPGYPYPTREYPDEKLLQQDQQHYHTRRQNSHRFWNHLQKP